MEFLKPFSQDGLIAPPAESSSLILVNIITLASTAIPMDKTIPAIPGSVSVLPMRAIAATSITMYASNAKFATSPITLYSSTISIKINITPIIPALTLFSNALYPMVASC